MKSNKWHHMTAIVFSLFIAGLVFVHTGEPVYAADDGIVVVSLGDSYSSGEGIPPFYGHEKLPSKKRKDQDWVAHRSEKSWPGMLKDSKGKKMKDVRASADNGYQGRWYFAAASGATTENIVSNLEPRSEDKKGYQKKDIMTLDEVEASKYTLSDKTKTVYLDPQLNIFDKLEQNNQKADCVTITIGGNDLGFAAIIEAAATPSFLLRAWDKPALEPLIKEKWALVEDGTIRDKLITAYTNIKESAGEDAEILVVGYPRLLNPKGSGVIITPDEADMINKKVARFDKELEEYVGLCKSDGLHIEYVSVMNPVDLFKGREAYTENALIRPVEFVPRPSDINIISVTSMYSMHPNEEGAKVYARCVQKEIDDIEGKKARERAKARKQLSKKVSRNFTKCNLIGKTYAEIEEEHGPLEDQSVLDDYIHLYRTTEGYQIGFLEYALNALEFDEDHPDGYATFHENAICTDVLGTAGELFGLNGDEHISEKRLAEAISAKYINGEPSALGPTTEDVFARKYLSGKEDFIEITRDGKRGTEIDKDTQILITYTSYYAFY